MLYKFNKNFIMKLLFLNKKINKIRGKKWKDHIIMKINKNDIKIENCLHCWSLKDVYRFFFIFISLIYHNKNSKIVQP
jgi:hypothetical protein